MKIPEELQPPESMAFLSVIPSRNPKHKMHKTLAHAKSAVGTRGKRTYSYSSMTGVKIYPDAAIYELTPDGWKLLHLVQNGVLPW